MPRPLYPPGKTLYPLYRSLGGHQGRSVRVWKISPPRGFDPWIVQPVASLYNHWAIPTAPLRSKLHINKQNSVYINQRDAQILVNSLYFLVKWLYTFRTIISPSSGVTFNKLYNAIGVYSSQTYRHKCTNCTVQLIKCYSWWWTDDSPKHVEPFNEKIKIIHNNLCISLIYVHIAIWCTVHTTSNWWNDADRGILRYWQMNRSYLSLCQSRGACWRGPPGRLSPNRLSHTARSLNEAVPELCFCVGCTWMEHYRFWSDLYPHCAL
jgi:hypothetical protein